MSTPSRLLRIAVMGPIGVGLALISVSCALHSQAPTAATTTEAPAEPPEASIPVIPAPPTVTRVEIEDERDSVNLASFFSSDRVVRLAMRNASLEEVISVFRRASDRKIRVAPEVERTVSASFHDLPLHDALGALLANLGLSAHLDGQTLRIAEPRPITVAFRLSLPGSSATWPESEWGSMKSALALALSEQGEVQSTPMGRVLLVRDRPENVDAAERILREIIVSLPEEPR